MGWEYLYIIIVLLGFGVVLAGARTISGYNRNSPNRDEARNRPPEFQADRADVAENHTHPDRQPRYPTVGFAASGRQFPLLDFIHSKGIEADCLCRAGECGACRTRVIEGEVTYLREPKIKLAEGDCLLCVSVPGSDLVLDR